MPVTLTLAVPIIPARDTVRSAEWYRDHLGFDADGNLLTFFERMPE